MRCPACPQPEINLPDDWKDDPERYAFSRLVDGAAKLMVLHSGGNTCALSLWMVTSVHGIGR